MAIALQPKYPAPDRSGQTIARGAPDDGVTDIGWCEGVMSDGRPFRAEMWAQSGISMITVFFSALGMETHDEVTLGELIVAEAIVSFRPDAPRRFTVMSFIDDAANALWSVNVVVGDEDATFVDESVPFFRVSAGRPMSLFHRSVGSPPGNGEAPAPS